MLISEIARQRLNATETALINDVLADWEADFPGASDLVTVAVWPDMIKCRGVSPFCRKTRPDALEFASSWHFDDKPYNPENITISDLFTDTWSGQPSASWLLTDAMGTFGESQSRFGFNLMLRFVVHILGDLHQPLHVTSGFFDDKRFGNLTMGDEGGNLIAIDSGDPGMTNLHAFWDAAGGLYQHGNWPLDRAQQAQLEANASAIMEAFPTAGFGVRYSPEDVANCWTVPEGAKFADDCGPTFLKWVNDAYAIAESVTYGPGFANGTKLSPQYVALAQKTSQSQIALGGYRLADLLKQVVTKLAALPPSKQQAARAKQVALEGQVQALANEVAALKAQLAAGT